MKIDCTAVTKISEVLVSFCSFGKVYEIEAIVHELNCLDATYFIWSKCGLLSKNDSENLTPITSVDIPFAECRSDIIIVPAIGVSMASAWFLPSLKAA